MDVDPIMFARMAFWILACLTVSLPARWSVIAFLLLVQFDLSGSQHLSVTAVGWENAIRIIVLPTLLLIRSRPTCVIDARFSRMCRFWLLFTVYAALAVVWSPYRMPAMKMLGYLYAYSILFLVFTTSWRRKWLNAHSLVFAVWASLLFAVVQTYFLGNQYGDPESGFRFTSFTGAQSFAPFLLSLFILLVFCQRWNLSVLAAAAGAAIGLILTGSRSLFLGFAWTVLTGGVVFAIRRGSKLNLRLIVKGTALSAGAVVCVGILLLNVLPRNRVNEMLTAMVSHDTTFEDVGTFAWRYARYEMVLSDLTGHSFGRLMIGSGTSSAASLLIESDFYQEENVDPNRLVHDEFLRSFYEWGLPGLLLLILFLVEAIKTCLKMIAQDGPLEAWAFLAVFVPLLITLTVENILADSGSPGGVGYNLVLTAMVAVGSARLLPRSCERVR